MNEKISKIKLELLKEEFTKQIKDSYILNLSMVVLEEFEKLQKENKQLKDKLIEINEVINGYMLNYYAMCKAFDEIEFIISKGVE